MKAMQAAQAALLLAVLAGCATAPTAPSVAVLPTEGKNYETFLGEDATCRRWAQALSADPVQGAPNREAAPPATAPGAGPAAALPAGAEPHYGWDAQMRYDNAYLQCMASYDNQLPAPGLAQPAPPGLAGRPPVPAPGATGFMVPPAGAVEPFPLIETAPTPGEFRLGAAPQFIFSPILGVWVAAGIPYDLLYDGYEYFLLYQGRWYRSLSYTGPWVDVARSGGRPGFLRYRTDEIRQYRDLEQQRFLREGSRYGGRVFRPGERR